MAQMYSFLEAWTRRQENEPAITDKDLARIEKPRCCDDVYGHGYLDEEGRGLLAAVDADGCRLAEMAYVLGDDNQYWEVRERLEEILWIDRRRRQLRILKPHKRKPRPAQVTTS